MDKFNVTPERIERLGSWVLSSVAADKGDLQITDMVRLWFNNIL